MRMRAARVTTGPTPGRLRPELAARVAVVARLAAARNVAAWLVGGTVRDLLLGRDGPDLDVVVVGDGVGLAAAVQCELGGRLLCHSEFLTADVIDAGGVHLDIATARQESYAAVAALPEVRPAATLDDDLSRRDFTVNAMALRLATDAENGLDLDGLVASSRLADPLGGRRDLAAGALRVLHQRSFLDDPTRVLRGVRFEVRLGLRLTPETEALARQAAAAGAFTRLSGSRLRRELELLLGAAPESTAAAVAGLERLHELGVLGGLHPRLAAGTEWPAARRRLLGAAAELAWYRAAGLANTGAAPAAGIGAAEGHRAAGAARAARAAGAAGSAWPPARPWLLLLTALAAGLSAEERGELAARLLLAGDERRLMTGFGGRLAAAVPRLGAGALPHEVDAALAGMADEELLLLAVQAGALARSWVRRYLTELRPLALGIGGAELLAAGARQGPGIGRALRATRDARLDGEIGPGEELAFALAHLRGAGGAGRGAESP
jgi:tRNA nucleotidyltransferase (CCA-adding enzyme)